MEKTHNTNKNRWGQIGMSVLRWCVNTFTKTISSWSRVKRRLNQVQHVGIVTIGLVKNIKLTNGLLFAVFCYSRTERLGLEGALGNVLWHVHSIKSSAHPLQALRANLQWKAWSLILGLPRVFLSFFKLGYRVTFMRWISNCIKFKKIKWIPSAESDQIQA